MVETKRTHKKHARPSGDITTFRLKPAVIDRLDQAAKRQKTSRTKLIRQFVEKGLNPAPMPAENPQLAAMIRSINTLNVSMSDLSIAQQKTPTNNIAAGAERIENLLRALTRIIFINMYTSRALTQELIAKPDTPEYAALEKEILQFADNSVPVLLQRALLMGDPTQ
jgi:predicted DNA-binding ribbon-helix-helix protein